MAFIDVTTRAALLVAINTTAIAGDVIRMAPGNYGDIATSRDFASKTMVISRDLDHSAIITDLDINGASRLTFEKVMFRHTGSTTRPFNVLSGSDRIEFNFCDFQSTNISGGFPIGDAVFLFGATNTTLIGCRISTWRNGIVIIYGNNTNVIGCDIFDIRSDGIDLNETTIVNIKGNHIHDFRGDWSSGDHGDGIQSFSPGALIATSGVTVTRNIVDIGDGSWFQMLFFRNEAVDTGFNPSLYYQDFVIEDNWVRGCFTWGLNVGAVNNLSVQRNAFIWVAMNTSQPYNAASIAAPEPDNHDGPNSIQAIPKIYFADATGARVVQNNTAYDAPFSTASRFFFDAGTSGWTVANNVVNSLSGSAPPKPTFVLGSDGTGGGVPVTPGITGGVTFRGGY